jgi:hypothetical protein
MPKFLVLYYSKVTAQERMDEAGMEKMQKSMQEWIDWKNRHGDALVDFGSPLKPVKQLADGKVEDAKSWTTGFSIVQADSVDAAVELLKDHPNFKADDGPGMQLLEFLPMPGM